VLCPYTNTNAKNVVKNSKRWCAFQKLTRLKRVRPAKAMRPKRKFPRLLRWEVHSTQPAFRQAAAVGLEAALVEQDKVIPAVRRFVYLGNEAMKIQNPEAKEKLIQRLRKIEGQVHGVQNMLGEERDCREIMQQLSAIHSAVQGASRIFLQEYATECLVELDENLSSLDNSNPRQKREKIIQDMITLLDKAP